MPIQFYCPKCSKRLSVPDSFANPQKCYDANLTGGLNLLAAARCYEVGAFVFSSSAAVYGPPESIPIAEDHPQAPISPYGFSKAAFERILADFDAAYPLRSIALRYFNAAGADPQGRAGERHDPHQKENPTLKCTTQGSSPFHRSGFQPQSRRTGPMGRA